jgi:hypothetical protein
LAREAGRAGPHFANHGPFLDEQVSKIRIFCATFLAVDIYGKKIRRDAQTERGITQP